MPPRAPLAAVIRDLARVKAATQLRTVAMALTGDITAASRVDPDELRLSLGLCPHCQGDH